METEETREIVETYGDAFKYKKVSRDRERVDEETTRDTCKHCTESQGETKRRLKRLWRPWRPATCKYKIVWRDRDWKRLGRLWRPVEVHECNVYGYGGTKGL